MFVRHLSEEQTAAIKLVDVEMEKIQGLIDALHEREQQALEPVREIRKQIAELLPRLVPLAEQKLEIVR